MQASVGGPRSAAGASQQPRRHHRSVAPETHAGSAFSRHVITSTPSAPSFSRAAHATATSTVGAASASPGHDGAPATRSFFREPPGSSTAAAAGSRRLATVTRATSSSSGGGGSPADSIGGGGGGDASRTTSGAGVDGGATGGVIRAAVGIDLGTTTSAVAVAGPDGRPLVVEDEAGRAVIPSVVFVRQDGSVLVGEEAVAASEADPANAFYGIKRLMGRTYEEALREVDGCQADSPSTSTSTWTSAAAPFSAGGGAASQDARQQQQQPQQQGRRRLRSYSLVEVPGGGVGVACPALGRSLAPQEVSAHLLRHLISRARGFLERQLRQQEGEERDGGGGERASAVAAAEVQVLDAVITVPAHYGPEQRRAVSEAARAAGLQRVTLLQEPIAAAMAYGFGSPQVPYDVLLVFDLGGGTLDLSIVEAFEGIMEVLSTSGDNYLGGDDFTAAIADWLSTHQHQQQLQQLRQQQQHQLSSSPSGTDSPPAEAAASSSSSVPAALPTASHSLALLRAAEAAKLALSEAVVAARAGSSTSSSKSGGSDSTSSSGAGSSSGGGSAGASVRVRLPSPTPAAAKGGGGGGEAPGSLQPASPSSPFTRSSTPPPPPPPLLPGGGEAELSSETFEQLIRPLLRRMWWPLEEVALATRTQLGGRLAPHLDPRSGCDSASLSSTGSGSVWDAEGPGRREGAAAWEFSIFPSPPSAGASGGTTGAKKYVAPPRRLSGLVLVGAATRLPVVRDYITEVTGLPVRPGIDPETAVAVGAALHAGLMVGSVTRGIEMNDGGYVAEQHGRASGFQVAAAAAGALTSTAAAGPGGGGGGSSAGVYDAEPELVWEP